MKRVKTNDQALTFLRLLVHGDSGIGKTSSILTLPVDSVHLAVTERGALPLRNHGYSADIIESWADLRDLVRMFQGERPADMANIKVLVLDSLTECSEFCKAEILAIARPAMLNARTDGKTDKPKGIYDEQMTQEDWGLYINRMGAFLGAISRLPINIIVTSLSIHKENVRTGEVLIVPDLSGKSLPFEAPSYFDVVAHMESAQDQDGKPTRVFRTANNGQVLAKDASGALLEIEPANWGHIFRKIRGANGSTPKKTTRQKKFVPQHPLDGVGQDVLDAVEAGAPIGGE